MKNFNVKYIKIINEMVNIIMYIFFFDCGKLVFIICVFIFWLGGKEVMFMVLIVLGCDEVVSFKEKNKRVLFY